MARLGPLFWPQKSPRKSLCGSLFASFARKWGTYTFFSGAPKVGVLGGGQIVTLKKFMCFFAPLFSRAHVSAKWNCGGLFWWLWRILRWIFQPRGTDFAMDFVADFCPVFFSYGKRRISWRILRPCEHDQRRKNGEKYLGVKIHDRKSTIKIHAELQVKHLANIFLGKTAKHRVHQIFFSLD